MKHNSKCIRISAGMMAVMLYFIAGTMNAMAQVHPEVTDSLYLEHIDTLHEVTVRSKRWGIKQALEASLEKNKQPATPSLGELLNKYLPNVNDYIMHPFGFKERKRNRQRKRTAKVLNDYDQVRSFKDLLDEAVMKQRLEDEAEKRAAEKQ